MILIPVYVVQQVPFDLKTAAHCFALSLCNVHVEFGSAICEYSHIIILPICEMLKYTEVSSFLKSFTFSFINKLIFLICNLQRN